MNIIYESRGRAQEYCKLAANLYKGCGHGCTYCYAVAATFSNREQFHRNPAPRPGVLEKLRSDTLGFKADSPVLLSFTSDPYQPIDQETGLAREAIKVMKQAGLKVAILTKGGHRADRDFDLLDYGDEFGVTLTCTDPDMSREWEPGAALPDERIASLKAAFAKGLKTWVSLEPVIDPEQTLDLIRQTSPFVNKFNVGILNHHPLSNTIDWRAFGERAVELLDGLGCQYYVKKDLRKWLN